MRCDRAPQVPETVRRRQSTVPDASQRDTLLPILAPMREPKIARASLGTEAMMRAAGRTWALRDGGTSAGGLASNLFLGGISQMGGPRCHHRGPETFAMVDGRMVEGRADGRG